MSENLSIDVENWIKQGAIISSDKDSVLVAWGNRNLCQDCSQKTLSFYFPDFFLEYSHPWHTYEQVKKVAINDLLLLLKPFCQTTPLSVHWDPPDQQLFKDAFSEIQQKIFFGELKKAVPFVFSKSQQRFSFQQKITSLVSALHYITSHAAFVYGFWDDDEGILGATPEILFKIEQHQMQTMACAGTTSADSDLAAFAQDPKQQREHQWVIEGIVDAINNIGSIKIEQTQVVKLSRLAHLVTPIRLDANSELSFDTLVKALHPTPALGAFPRKEGWIWLRSFQKKINRCRFGAPVGFFSPIEQKGSCYVAIRNIQWQGNTAFVGAGCGIIADSQYEQEWKEILLKLTATKEMLSV